MKRTIPATPSGTFVDDDFFLGPESGAPQEMIAGNANFWRAVA